jgi:hypothetical protein
MNIQVFSDVTPCLLVKQFKEKRLFWEMFYSEEEGTIRRNVGKYLSVDTS